MAVTLSGLLIADPSAASVTLDSVGSGEVSVLEVLPAAVAGRFLFYNNSSFDQSGNSNAVATDKQALLPGGQASFANYSSYHNGISGVIVDIDNLADAGAIDAADFGFRLGNSAQLGDRTPITAGWDSKPRPVFFGSSAGPCLPSRGIGMESDQLDGIGDDVFAFSALV